MQTTITRTDERGVMAEMNHAEVVRWSPLSPGPDGRASRSILGSDTSVWDGIVMGEWQLTRAWFEDMHPHDEVNHVLEGELLVTCAGVLHRLGPGDTIRVPGGTPAKYAAPAHARMIFLYGPNPIGLPSQVIGSGQLPSRQ